MALQTAHDVLSRHYLEIRCGLLDLAASLDRVDRAPGHDQVAADPRLREIREGIQILLDGVPNRAERIQLLFSDAYREGWNR